MHLLPKTYFPPHNLDRFYHRGDTAGARRYFEEFQPSNLKFLLQKRYTWMNDFIQGRDSVIELGCGAGFGSYFYRIDVKLTDFEAHPWVDDEVDALKLPYENGSIDAFICSHMIHHVAKPKLFLDSMGSKLCKGGLIIIQEVETSWLMKVLLMVTRHEGWSDEIKIFWDDQVCNDADDPWSANCAIPRHLFADEDLFHQNMPNFRIIKNDLCEFFIFAISGGVIVRSPTINLPNFMLHLLDGLDNLLIGTAPKIFALGRSVVLEKIA